MDDIGEAKVNKAVGQRLSDDAQRFWDRVYINALDRVMELDITIEPGKTYTQVARTIADHALEQRAEAMEERAKENLDQLRKNAEDLRGANDGPAQPVGEESASLLGAKTRELFGEKIRVEVGPLPRVQTGQLKAIDCEKYGPSLTMHISFEVHGPLKDDSDT